MQFFNKPITTLIIDDEPLSRNYLRQLLKKDHDIKIIGECSDGQTAVYTINELKPQLIFLDIEMPELDGFEVVTNIKTATKPIIIFITAYNQYALKAFSSHAIDYIVKPIEEKRLVQTLEHVKNIVADKRKISELEMHYKSALNLIKTNIRSFNDLNASDLEDVIEKNISNTDGRYLKRIIVKHNGKKLVLDVNKIDYFRVAAPYVEVHAQNKKYLIRQHLTWLEQKLDPSLFVRTHRSTIVRTKLIKEMKKTNSGDYTLFLDNGSVLPLSRRRAKEVEKLISII